MQRNPFDCHGRKLTAIPVGAWLASEGALKPFFILEDAFAGKPCSYRVSGGPEVFGNRHTA